MLKKLYQNKYFFPVVIGIVIFVAYYSSINNDFIRNWDDNLYIIDNNLIQNDAPRKMGRIFTEYWMGHYHPLTILFYDIQYGIFELHPKPFHITSIFLHIINSLLVYWFILLLFKHKNPAFILALIFGIHPMHVESVAWISSQKDLLYSMFYLASLITYLFYKNSRKISYLIITLLWFVLSALSKSAAIVLPLSLLLIDFFIEKKFIWRLVIEKIPFFLISLFFGILSLYSQKAPIINAPDFSFFERLILIVNAFSYYLIQFFVPNNMSAIHYFPESGHIPLLYYFSILPVIIIIFILFKFKSHRKLLIFSFGFFLINCLLIIQIFPIGEAYVAERYTYMPYFGLSFIFMPLLSNTRVKKTIYSIAMVSVLVLLILTNLRTKKWKDGIVLFSDVIKKYPDKAFAYYNRGSLYLHNNIIIKAKSDFDSAIKSGMNHPKVYFSRGTAYLYMKKYNKAINDFNKSLESDSCAPLTLYNKGLAFAYLQKYNKAINNFGKALNCNPELNFIYYDLANAHLRLKDFNLAIKFFNKSAKNGENVGNSYYLMGMCYYYLSNIDSACIAWTNSAQAGNNRARQAIQANCISKH